MGSPASTLVGLAVLVVARTRRTCRRKPRSATTSRVRPASLAGWSSVHRARTPRITYSGRRLGPAGVLRVAATLRAALFRSPPMVGIKVLNTSCSATRITWRRRRTGVVLACAAQGNALSGSWRRLIHQCLRGRAHLWPGPEFVATTRRPRRGCRKSGGFGDGRWCPTPAHCCGSARRTVSTQGRSGPRSASTLGLNRAGHLYWAKSGGSVSR